MDAVDLGELHGVVEQGLGDDVQDTLPLGEQEEEHQMGPTWIRSGHWKHLAMVTMEKTRHLAPGSVSWIFLRVLTTASTLVEWLP